MLKAGPCVVVQAKTAQTDGYEAVQLGLVEERPAKVGKPLAGHYKKANVPPTRVRREVKVTVGGCGIDWCPSDLQRPRPRVRDRASPDETSSAPIETVDYTSSTWTP